MADEQKTITLPLDVVKAWREDAQRMGWVEDRQLIDAIDAAVWKPEQGIHYKATEHRPLEGTDWVLMWAGARWVETIPAAWSDKADCTWMLMPPAPEVTP